MIKRGMCIVFKPEWRDKGDDKYTFVATNDEHNGWFDVSTVEPVLALCRTYQRVRVEHVESSEPYLPVIRFVFTGLFTGGAAVQMRREMPDCTVQVTDEVIAKSTFRNTWRKFAKDCKPGEVLQISVEFPVTYAIAPHTHSPEKKQ